MWGYFAYRHQKRYKKQMQNQGYYIPKNDKLSSYLALLSFIGVFIGFVLAGVPYEHAFHPDPTDLFYTHQEAIKLLNNQIIGSLTILLITILYLVSRMVLNKRPQRLAR
jgi:disulfide bond formation protein DsbB